MIISEKENTRISKFLSLVLRHQPDLIGITLDENGWTDIETLLVKANSNGLEITESILNHIVETNAKQRFAIDETGKRIRANQGHSVEIDLGYIAVKPPEILYHGTGKKSVESILKTGIEKKDRHHVHLSSNLETAVSVGKRHGVPYVFKVLSGKMHDDNFAFFQAENGVWLTDNVPTNYIEEHNSNQY